MSQIKMFQSFCYTWLMTNAHHKIKNSIVYFNDHQEIIEI